MAGTIKVINENTGITVPQTRVYKTCLGAISGQTFGSLAPSDFEVQTRSSLVSGACVWAREVGVEPRYVSCSTEAAMVPADPNEIIVHWTGSNADNLECYIQFN
jgi:hypothetical protein